MSPRRQRRGREDDARARGGAQYRWSERAIDVRARDRCGARDEETRDGGRVASRASTLAAPRIQNHPSNSQKIKRAFARRGRGREGMARTGALALLLFLFFAAIVGACAESFGVKSRCVEGLCAAAEPAATFQRTSTEPLRRVHFRDRSKPERGTSQFDGFASVSANRFWGAFPRSGKPSGDSRAIPRSNRPITIEYLDASRARKCVRCLSRIARVARRQEPAPASAAAHISSQEKNGRHVHDFPRRRGGAR